MINRLGFLLMAFAQVLFGVRLLLKPEAAKAVNVKLGTIWAKLPVAFYRALGVVCSGAAILFFYLCLFPPRK
jgi:hypothetical protein